MRSTSVLTVLVAIAAGCQAQTISVVCNATVENGSGFRAFVARDSVLVFDEAGVKSIRRLITEPQFQEFAAACFNYVKKELNRPLVPSEVKGGFPGFTILVFSGDRHIGISGNHTRSEIAPIIEGLCTLLNDPNFEETLKRAEPVATANPDSAG